jgi:hypothetical protein
MSAPRESRTLNVSIDRLPGDVYRFAANPENLSRWAAGLGRSARKEADGWVVETLLGDVRLRFEPENTLGVLDHYVMLPGEVEVYVPMRVLANGSGSEVVFTLFRLPGMTDEQYAADATAVQKDLQTLKRVLEEEEPTP